MTWVPLTEAGDENAHGGKAVSLGACLRHGLPVPHGFAISVSALEAITAESATALAAAGDVLGRFPGRPRLAVRSSAVGEDSAAASFAGQHVTRLGVCTVSGLLDALAAVWASGRSDSALAYRRKLGIEAPPRVAAVVQSMITPRCAGVLFCRDPIDGSDRRVIEAAWGLGESVVAGTVVPDRFVLDRDGAVIERRAGLKDVAIVMAPDGQETEEIVVAEQRQRTLCLDDAQLRALYDLGTRCEEVFGRPQDVEWAVTDDAVHLLQSRPITR